MQFAKARPAPSSPMIEAAGFHLVAIKQPVDQQNSRLQAFTQSTAQRPFFNSLTDFYVFRSHLLVMVLEKENAIADLRKLMGATKPFQCGRRHHPQEVCGQH